MALSSRYISLFCGCGGLDLAVGLAIENSRCVCRVENDAAVARILAARMEEGSLEPSPVWSDARTFDGRAWRGYVDGIVGGFPCTDLSVAGKQAGIDGEHSGLWWEFARIIREIQPGWVYVENVPPVLSFSAGRAVLGELNAIGYDAEWLTIRASDVGAGHQRKRVFILAYRGREYGELQQRPIRPELEGGFGIVADSAQRGCGERGESPGSHGQLNGSHAAMGESAGAGSPERGDDPGIRECAAVERTGVVEHADHIGQHPSRRGWPKVGGAEECRRDADLGYEAEESDSGLVNAEFARRQAPRIGRHEHAGPQSEAGGGIFAPGPSDPRWPAIIERYPFLAPATQPGIRLLADGMAFLVDASRTDQLRAAGNGVVAIQGAAALIELIRRVGNA